MEEAKWDGLNHSLSRREGMGSQGNAVVKGLMWS